jgi:hypothetical protein
MKVVLQKLRPRGPGYMLILTLKDTCIYWSIALGTFGEAESLYLRVRNGWVYGAVPGI